MAECPPTPITRRAFGGNIYDLKDLTIGIILNRGHHRAHKKTLIPDIVMRLLLTT